MAAISFYTHFRGTEVPDGLCPLCHNPALKLYHLQRVDMDGITVVGTRVACGDCNKWLAPLVRVAAE